MRIELILPYLLGGSAITAFLAALRWGRQDARESVEAAVSNQDAALRLRDSVMADNDRLRAELAMAQAEVEGLRRQLVAVGVEPRA